MAVLSIPISSAICARATVAYTQSKRNLNLRQTLALADRGWWDPFILSRLVLPGGLVKYGTPFLIFAAVVCALGAVAWPLQQVLVKDVTILLVPSVNDTGPSLLAYDADILGMSQVGMNSVVRDTKRKLETGSHWDQQPQIWQDPSMMCNSTSVDFTEWCYTLFNGHNNQTNLVSLPGDKYWISNLVATTNTGLVKEHSLRLNSSINCQAVSDSEYPDICSGFETSTSTHLPDSEDSANADRSFEFKVCAPGSDQPFPWKLVRDRQEISDSVFMQLNSDGLAYLSGTLDLPDAKRAVTVRCSTETTTGYFTLPNKVDTPLAGPILEGFNLSAASDFTQYINNDSEHSFSNYELSEWLGVFLNAKTARHSHLNQDYVNDTISTALRAGIIYAEQSILSQAAAQPVWHRTLLETPGIEMRKPSVTNTSIILISVILALHLIGLWLLAIFAMVVPTWTRSLDSWALIRMGAAISEEVHADLPLLGNIRADEAKILDHMEGWVGESSTEEDHRQETRPYGTHIRSIDEDGSGLPPSKISAGPIPRITIGGSRKLRRGTSYALFRSEISEHGLSLQQISSFKHLDRFQTLQIAEHLVRPDLKSSQVLLSDMPLSNSDSGITSGVKAVTSTVGNTVSGLSNTVGGIVGATGRGLGETVNGATGKAGKPVGDGLTNVGTGVENAAADVAKGARDAGEGRSGPVFHK
ncbi:MAG: hypothetical protein Q9160_003893 [Pyrenula sp. 1 TL-2023]